MLLDGNDTRAFGTRLRRLSERLDAEVQGIYRACGEDFEPRWFAVVAALRESGPATVGEVSARLGVSHAAVSQVRAALVAKGLLEAFPDPADHRRQLLTLSTEGEAAARRLQPLWTAIAAATDELLSADAPRLLPELAALEVALAQRGLGERVLARLAANQLNADTDEQATS